MIIRWLTGNNIMKIFRMICCIFFLVALVGITGCYQLVYRSQDEKNVRRQLHIPKDVRLISFDSNPKEAGFFGREGLQISAEFLFDDKQFEEYLDAIKDTAQWQAVSFISYSPDRADEYSPDAFRWFDLPAPSWVGDHFKHWEHLPAVREVTQGKYYGSVVTARQGARIDHPDGNYHYKCEYIGLSFSELDEPVSMIITTFAVLDVKIKKLYAIIAFSG